MKQPHKYRHDYNAHECEGDYIYNAKNCVFAYNTVDTKDVRYTYECGRSDTCIDATDTYDSSGIVDSINLFKNQFVGFSWSIVNSSNIYYSSDLTGCHDCLLCTGLQNVTNCILNKQYTKEEYNKLAPQIIANMREMGEW